MSLQVNDLTPEIIVAVAKAGEPRTVHAVAGSDLLKIVSKYCGTSNARRYYLPVFLAANAGIAEIKSGKTILSTDADLHVPACIHADDQIAVVKATTTGPNWSEPSALPWQKQNTRLPKQLVDFQRLAQGSGLPESLASRGSGLVAQIDSQRLEDPTVRTLYNKLLNQLPSGDSDEISEVNVNAAVRSASFSRSLRTQDVLASNNSVDFSRLSKDSSIFSSSFSPERNAFKLKPGIDVDSVVASLVKAGVKDIAVTSDYIPYFAEPQSADDGNCSLARSEAWPINAEELRKVLEFRSAVGRQPRAGSILVFDTGFPKGKVGVPPFEAAYFIRSESDSSDEDTDPYLWTSLPSIYFYEGFKESSHGVQVVSLALGGVDVLNSRMLPNFVRAPDGEVISMMGYLVSTVEQQKILDVNGTALNRTIAGGNWGQAAVSGVNMSLRFAVKEYGGLDLSANIAHHPEVLYVFAAGNDGKDLSGWQAKPATWGGLRIDNVITVGAIKPDGTYWNKSNWSAKYVDIAAPGCGVPTFTWDPVSKRFTTLYGSGTSLSSPLVSFAGSLLRDDFTTTKRIKIRLLTSGHFYPGLVDKVASARSLDVPNAISVYFDTVRDAEDRLRLGRIDWQANGRSVCNEIRKRNEVLQISRYQDNHINKLHVALMNSDDDFSFVQCELVDSELTQIQFQEALIKDGHLTFRSPEGLNIRNLNSITLRDKYLPPQ
jgi:hypothetical protein